VIAAEVAHSTKSNFWSRRVAHACRWVTIAGVGFGCALLLSKEARAQDAEQAAETDVAAPVATEDPAPRQGSTALDLASPFALADPRPRSFKAQLSVTSAPVPTLDASDGSPKRVRVDLTGWSHTPDVSGVGLSLQSSVAQTSHMLVPLAPGASSTDMDLAVRWRSAPWSGNRRVDVAAWRRVTPDAVELARTGDGQAVYGARVEMQFSSIRASRRLVPELGAIGFQFDGGAKLSLRAKSGKPMLYYRSSF
jgi:hypothetical protein